MLNDQFFNFFEGVLKVQVYYLVISIFFHVALQTLVNHFHYMRADKQHSRQLEEIRLLLKKGKRI